MKIVTQEDWLKKCNEVHKNKYDYSLVKYINAREKVDVICHEKDEFGKEHGIFSIRAGNHSSGTGCPKCGKRWQMTKEDFVLKSRQVHGDKYDYTHTIYEKSTKKVKIRCPKHGIFEQVASSHMYGCGCPKCNKGIKYDIKSFIERAREVHGDYYDYTKVEYVNAKVPVEIICPRHGSFFQTPDAHDRGCGCPQCKSSKLEDIVIQNLNKFNIPYIYNSKILSLGNQTIDFYLPNKNIVIECQGEQHYRPIKFRFSESDELSKERLNERKKLDKEKYKKCIKLGFEMVYFTIPRYFINNTTNVRTGFYKGKKVYTEISELISYIQSVPDIEDVSNNYYVRLNKSLEDRCTFNDDELKYKNYLLKIITLESTNEKIANKYRIASTKRNYNPIIIFEDEYINKYEIVVSKIKHIFGINDSLPKIYGRKCTVSEIDKTKSDKFLEVNHIQGKVNGTIYLGAFYENKLIGVMVMCKNGEGSWIISRFASDIKYLGVGIFGKLLKYFISNYEYEKINTFADRRWTLNTDSNLYTKLGFTVESIEKPDYRYIVGKERKHKFLFRKQILHKKYGLPLTMTENEMTKQLGYTKIWDCGLIKYVYHKY